MGELEIIGPPAEIETYIDYFMPHPLRAKAAYMRKEGSPQLYLEILDCCTGTTIFQRFQAYCDVSMHLKQGNINLHDLSYAGLGTVCQYLLENIFIKSGFAASEVYAADLSGSYMWARCGYLPDVKHRAYLARALEKKIGKLSAKLLDAGFDLKPDVSAYIGECIENLDFDPKAIRKIAALNLFMSDLVAVRPIASLGRLERTFDDWFWGKDEAGAQYLAIGKWFLVGESWDGVLNFQDREAMNIREENARRAFEKLFVNSFVPTLKNLNTPNGP
ncbi:MAG: hypothetical protein GC136_02135 [Alphaproteobacteria bacterium]|nr:hypothetical protein [Alphaproteobacteria bacterium]